MTPWVVAHQSLLSMGFPRQEYWLLLLLLSCFSRVRLCATPWTAAWRILEWAAISYSMGSSWTRDWTHSSWVSCIAGGFFTTVPYGLGNFIGSWAGKLFQLFWGSDGYDQELGHCPLFGRWWPWNCHGTSGVKTFSLPMCHNEYILRVKV